MVTPVREPGLAPGIDAIWKMLATIPDPEIPVISIVELGIVRDVAWEDDALVIRVTPTYSGCPATEAIRASITSAIEAIGIRDVRIDTVLAPAWTTDWVAPEARAKLQAFGIAPPQGSAQRIDVASIGVRRRDSAAVPCPRCGSTSTRLLSQFGSTACKAQYRCDACLEPFDYFKAF